MVSSERAGVSRSSSPGAVPAVTIAPGTSTLNPAAAKPKRKKSKSHSLAQGNTPGLRSCTISTCRRPLPVEWKHRTCEHCLQRSRRSRERRRLRTMLEKALEADSEEVSSFRSQQFCFYAPYQTLPRRRACCIFPRCPFVCLVPPWPSRR